MRSFYENVNSRDKIRAMSRVISTTSPGKDRILIEKGIVSAIHELAKIQIMDDNTRDLLAYIALSLLSIGETIDASVAAWEKRGYWVKTDRYRMEWTWASRLGSEMKQAILVENWGEVARITGLVTQKLTRVKISQRNRLGSPWVGSYKKLIRPNQSH
jgi:hypothetical protein